MLCDYLLEIKERGDLESVESDVRPTHVYIANNINPIQYGEHAASLPEIGGGAELRRGDNGGVARPLSAGPDVSVGNCIHMCNVM